MKSQSKCCIIEDCREEALKYKTKIDFFRNCRRLYDKAYHNNWLDDVCSHMKYVKRVKWNYKIVELEALKYESRKNFCKKSYGAYNYAKRNNKLDIICKHMKIVGNLKKRAIYCVLFNDKYFYVGLTCNFERRIKEHLDLKKLTSVGNYIIKSNLTPHFLKITDYVDVETAKVLEKKYLKYFIKKKYKTLNKVETGALGSMNVIWNKETCYNLTKKYTEICDFKKEQGSCYNSIIMNGWLDELCGHMNRKIKKHNYWQNKDICYKEAIKYNNKTDFIKHSKTAYDVSKANDWVDNICKHMIIKEKLDFNKCRNIALAYNYRSDFQKYNKYEYNFSRKNGFLNEICIHMIDKKIKWTFENCKTEALKYEYKKDFFLKSKSSYEVARKNGWLKEICLHMNNKNLKWTFENCKKEALKYNCIKDLFKNSRGAYNSCTKNKWMNSVCQHMTKK